MSFGHLCVQSFRIQGSRLGSHRHQRRERNRFTHQSNNRNQNLLVVLPSDEMTISPSSLICILLFIAVSVQSVSILEGDFETTTDVQEYLNLALHAAAMKEAEDLATKKRIYSQVGNTYITWSRLDCKVSRHALLV